MNIDSRYTLSTHPQISATNTIEMTNPQISATNIIHEVSPQAEPKKCNSRKISDTSKMSATGLTPPYCGDIRGPVLGAVLFEVKANASAANV